jgi:uncharacterized protein YyaL (SSP411 family)
MFDLIAPQQVVVVLPSPSEGDAVAVSGRSVFGHAMPAPEEAVAGAAPPVHDRVPLARAMFRLSLPGAVQQVVENKSVPQTGPVAGKNTVDGKPTAYACIGPQCSLPVSEADALLELLRRQRSVSSA